jgi:hypothetical protein
MSVTEWRPVVGYEGTYEVSSQGQVRRVGAEKPLKAHFAGKRRSKHLHVDLYRNSVRKTCMIHQLVAAAFIGPRPPGMQIRHLDGNSENNMPENLTYGTQSENALDSVKHGSHHQARKTHCPSGHEYAGDNLYLKSGQRNCKQCTRKHDADYRSRKKARDAARNHADSGSAWYGTTSEIA